MSNPFDIVRQQVQARLAEDRLGKPGPHDPQIPRVVDARRATASQPSPSHPLEVAVRTTPASHPLPYLDDMPTADEDEPSNPAAPERQIRRITLGGDFRLVGIDWD